ncbi:MAG: CoA transferase [Alphaproteobacteria bacterium]|nr:CoA transferase [Alphaproteobacteria bacterium]
MSKPLDGVRILDFTRVLSGPFATMMLADLGADVVKIERASGDDTRGFGPPFDRGVSTYFVSINRGKRSVVADLRDPEDLAWIKRLIAEADVLVENFRPGTMQKLGLGPEDLRPAHPRLIYCSISGFGRDDPSPGYDLVVQGLSGVPSVTGPGDQPWKCGASIADLVAGHNAAQGILAALYKRATSGEGSLVDVSMLDGSLALLTYHASAWLNAGVAPRARGNAHPSIHPFRPYRASDGWVNFAVGNDPLFVRLCGALGVSWHEDPRFARNPDRVSNREALNALLEPLVIQHEVAWWERVLAEAGVPGGRMASVEQALTRATVVEHAHPSGDGQVSSLGPALRFEGEALVAERPPPALGAHAEDVFADWLG